MEQSRRESWSVRVEVDKDLFEMSHNVFDMIDGMGEKELKILDMMIMAIASDKNPEAAAAYYRGYIDKLMNTKYKLCSFCRKSFEREEDHRHFFAETFGGETSVYDFIAHQNGSYL